MWCRNIGQCFVDEKENNRVSSNNFRLGVDAVWGGVTRERKIQI